MATRPRATRILIAPDKFKGTLTAAQVAGHLAEGIVLERPDVEVVVVPVADGAHVQSHGPSGSDWPSNPTSVR